MLCLLSEKLLNFSSCCQMLLRSVVLSVMSEIILMLFSVVIPTYNRAQLLRGTLESVWRQHFADFETIVVDDGSTDQTQEYLCTLGDKVQVIRQENCGPGAARNAGARAARGDYVALLDSDDLWFPWTLNVFANAIEQFGRPVYRWRSPC